LSTYKPGDQSHGGGFRGGFCPWITVGGEFFRKMLEAATIPVFTLTAWKSTGKVESEPERFGIPPANNSKRFGRFGHNILFFSKE
jgi:hypothetical protein